MNPILQADVKNQRARATTLEHMDFEVANGQVVKFENVC
jgi:hypothetical protein